MPYITVIIPAYNEKDNILPMVEKLETTLVDYSWEIIFIDDGSSDGSLELLKTLNKNNPRINYISFSKNFGHQVALKAGFDNAKGDCVISMDADMQHPPELLPEIIDKWLNGYDAVHTTRTDPASLPIRKRLLSRYYYTILNRLAQTNIPKGAADFRLVDRRIVEICKTLHETTFFWRGLIPWLGFKQCYVPYLASERFAGKTKYSFKKMIQLAWNGITSFSVAPLRFASILGISGICLSILFLIFTFASYLAGNTVTGWASVVVLVSSFGGLQLLCLGLLGEYIGKIHINTIRRPPYIIAKTSVSSCKPE